MIWVQVTWYEFRWCSAFSAGAPTRTFCTQLHYCTVVTVICAEERETMLLNLLASAFTSLHHKHKPSYTKNYGRLCQHTCVQNWLKSASAAAMCMELIGMGTGFLMSLSTAKWRYAVPYAQNSCVSFQAFCFIALHDLQWILSTLMLTQRLFLLAAKVHNL